jgi:hypothetical protein
MSKTGANHEMGRVLCGTVLAGLFVLVPACEDAPTGAPDRRGVSVVDENEPLTAMNAYCGLALGTSVDAMHRNAVFLAHEPTGIDWVVLALAASPPADDAAKNTHFFASRTIVPDPYALSVLIQNIEPGVPKSVLVALTLRLADTRRGKYPSNVAIGPVVLQRGDSVTPPLRELAREALIRCTGTDHKFDAAEWYLAISGGAERCGRVEEEE